MRPRGWSALMQLEIPVAKVICELITATGALARVLTCSGSMLSTGRLTDFLPQFQLKSEVVRPIKVTEQELCPKLT